MNKKNLYKTLDRLKGYSLVGLLRLLRLHLTGKTVIVEGRCNLCGGCCSKISLDGGGKWLRNEKDFERIIKNNPEYKRFEKVGKDEQGFLLFTCSWLSDERVCRDHQNRLSICSDYPNIHLYFTGGKIAPECGYSFKEVKKFSKILREELKDISKE